MEERRDKGLSVVFPKVFWDEIFPYSISISFAIIWAWIKRCDPK